MNKFLATVLLTLTSIASHAQMDIDQADSLDFEAFHTEKEEAIKLQDVTNDQPQRPGAARHYSDTSPDSRPDPHPNSGPDSDHYPPQTSAANKSNSDIPAAKSNSGKFFEIRARYTPVEANQARSSQATGQSASSAVNALHQQMAQLCPQGWTKLGEKSLPSDNAFYLYYEFRCF